MTVCEALHAWVNALDAHRFPFDIGQIPLNGIYVLFENGEVGHGAQRIVRVGTHTGHNQLPSRLRQHFLIENKDRSIFRKNIGRALLNRDQDPFLSVWELDRTSRAMRNQHGQIDLNRQSAVEAAVSEYIREQFSFVVIPVAEKTERLRIESQLISTVSRCGGCRPSERWLGSSSPKAKIRDSGLWLVNELYKEPLSLEELHRLTDRSVAVASLK